jgi:hypothetical protein
MSKETLRVLRDLRGKTGFTTKDAKGTKENDEVRNTQFPKE